MAKQRESELSRRIKNVLRARGHWVWKTHADRYVEPGISDLIGARFGDGRFISIETKIKTNLSPAQAEFLSTIGERTFENACAGEARSIDQAISIVESMDWIKSWDQERRRFLLAKGMSLPIPLRIV